MPNARDRQKYADTMTYLRYRLEVIDRLLSRQVTTGFEIPDLETTALQFRKVFEHIVMSSLCANRDGCAQVKTRFDKMWKASAILKFVEKLNPNFYPIPIERVFNEDRATGGTISHLRDGFLTRDELTEAHGRCGDLLHADNPYKAQRVAVDEWHERFRDWNRKTRGLLELHTAQLIDQDIQWWVVMRFGTAQPVQVAEFRRVENLPI